MYKDHTLTLCDENITSFDKKHNGMVVTDTTCHDANAWNNQIV